MDDDAEVEELFAQLAYRLLTAHRAADALEADEAEKSSVHRRLKVVNDLAKHSLPRASQRLDALLAELRTRHPGLLERFEDPQTR